MRMTDEERKNWILGLKAEDVVAIKESVGNEAVWFKTTVERITPTGRIKVRGKNGIIDFGKNGYVRSGDAWSRSSQDLVPWKDEYIAVMERRKLVNSVVFYLHGERIDREKVKAASDEKLKELLAELRSLRVDPKEKPA